ncbi:MAG: hypothetical protein RQ733_13960 [Methyloprofundus sp.]|nr:hypothetical protein [Methyloprofundus sp.]
MFRILLSALIVSIFLASFTGCGKREPRRVDTIYNPPLQTFAVAELGDTMIETSYGYVAIKSFATLENESDKIKYNLQNKYKFAPWTFNLKKHDCVLHARENSLIDIDCDGKFDLSKSGDNLHEPVPYTVEKKDHFIAMASGSYKKEVIYQGKIGNKINMLYREFFANGDQFMIRDAFTQKIEYELDENGKALVGFKGLRMDIIEASNNSIKYKIIKDFN